MSSTSLLRICVLMVLATLPLVACGGDDDDSDSIVPGGQSNGEDEPNGSDSEPDDIDIGSRPEAGEARLEVDGRTFTGEIHACELVTPEGGDEATAILIGASSEDGGERVEFGTNGGRPPQTDNWTAQSAITIGGSIAYHSGSGDVAVDGQTVVYVGDYGRMKADGSGLDDVGEGRLTATCP